MVIFMAAGIGLLAAALVLWPLLSREVAAAAETEGQDLLLERERVFCALRELEYDRAMGKVDDQDYSAQQQVYTDKAVKLLKEEEILLKDVDEAMEAEIAADVDRLRAQSGGRRKSTAAPRKAGGAADEPPRFCAQCGGKLIVATQRFCQSCGQPTEMEAKANES